MNTYFKSSIKTTPIMNEIVSCSDNITIKIPKENTRLNISYYGKYNDLDSESCYEITIINQKHNSYASDIVLLLRLPEINNGSEYAKINICKDVDICFNNEDMKFIPKYFDKLDRDIILGFCNKYKDQLKYVSTIEDFSILYNIFIASRAKHFVASQIPKNEVKRKSQRLQSLAQNVSLMGNKQILLAIKNISGTI